MRNARPRAPGGSRARAARPASGGGRATSGGTHYQASASAFVAVAIITETPIAWFGRSDVPTAITAETGGPGDDLRIEFGQTPTAGEVQARHFMNAAGDFTDFVAAVADRTGAATPTPVALVADRRASDRLFREVAKELDKLRDGLSHEVGGVVKREMEAGHERILEKLYVVPADFDDAHSPERANAVASIRHQLVDGMRAEEAWDILVADGLRLAADGGRRDRAALIDLLAEKGIVVAPLPRDQRWLAQLEFITSEMLDHSLIDQAHAAYAKTNAEMDAATVSPRTRAMARRHLAVALLAIGKPDEAVEAARRAVEFDGDWADAHGTYAHALTATGQRELAIAHADRAVALNPGSFRAWTAKVRVADTFALGEVVVPGEVLGQRDFRQWLVSRHRELGSWDDVLNVSTGLLAEANPTPHVRFFHAEALVLRVEAGGGADADLHQAIDELSSLIDSLPAEHPLLAPAYQVRSRAKGRTGNEAGARADEAAAQRANRDDPVIVRAVASAQASRGDLARALETLQAPSVASDPGLLALRAGILAGTGRKDEARQNLAAAVAALESVTDPELDLVGTLYTIGSVAVDLGNLDQAREVLRRMSDGGGSPAGELLAGEIDFAAADSEAAEARYLAAINLEQDVERGRLIRVQLGMRLLDVGRPERAWAMFDDLSLDVLANMPEAAMRAYAVAALRTQRLDAASAAIDKVGEQGPLPLWALSIRADIALRTEDPEVVVAATTAMEAQGASTARINLTMTRALIELGRKDEALERVRIATGGAMVPLERAEAAGYLSVLGEPGIAIDEAFRAFREDRGNPDTQRVLASLVFTSRVAIPHPDTVRAGAHVVLVRNDGQTREHSIFGDALVDKASGELSIVEAEAAGLAGLRVGDMVADAEALPRDRWVVKEVVAAVVKAAQRIAATFSDNFPTEPFFMKMVHVGDLSKPADIAPIISMAEDRRKRVTAALGLYHERVLPLGMLTNLIGAGAEVTELMAAAESDPLVRPLLVESADSRLYGESVNIASDAETVVLTRSALYTARRFDLIDLLPQLAEVVAPTSLLWELRTEIESKAAAVATGRSTMVALPDGRFTMLEAPPNDPSLISALADATETLSWVEANARALPRPLTSSTDANALGDRQKERDEIRTQVGPSSFDAAVLGENGIGALYADDLGLRTWSMGSGRAAAGFSTITLVEALSARNALDAARLHALQVDLLLIGYSWVRPTLGMLNEAVTRMPSIGRERLEAVFAQLASDLVTPGDAARLVMAVIVEATRRLEIVRLETLTEVGVSALARRMPKAIAAHAVKRLAEPALRLNPLALDRINKTCDRLAIEEPRIIQG
jgi:tetratricopeptide (TPR) repeat protein